GRDGVVEDPAAEPGDLPDVGRPAGLQGVLSALSLDLRPTPGTGVQHGQLPGERAQRFAHRYAGADQGGQAPLRWHPAHHHRRFAAAADGIADLGQTEVHVRCDPAVQADLAKAGLAATLLATEVQEAGTDRLLDLIRAVTDQEHHPDMGLVHACVGSRRRAIGAHRCVHRSSRLGYIPRLPGAGSVPLGPMGAMSRDSRPVREGRPPGAKPTFGTEGRPPSPRTLGWSREQEAVMHVQNRRSQVLRSRTNPLVRVSDRLEGLAAVILLAAGIAGIGLAVWL